MITVRKAEDRGQANYGWLRTFHTFSFSDYYDPHHMRFRTLRVMNEDFVAPNQGFGTHPHHDMEIITYVLEGSIAHRDSMGNTEVLRAGEFQRMTAGSGITHSEFNASSTDTLHLYQIWIFPDQKGLTPSYEQKAFPVADRTNRWQLVASPSAEAGSLTIHQDAKVYLANLTKEQSLSFSLAPSRHAWLQVLRGEVQLGEHTLSASDGAAISEQDSLKLVSLQDSELMLFDLA